MATLSLPKGFVLPKLAYWDQPSLSQTFGRLVVQPFERGFALTIGNTLRRVLLSSIEGAAVTSIRIVGVLHEFCSLRGVMEDVADIVLNVKALRLKLHTDRPKTLYLKAAGEGRIFAVKIQPDPDVEVLNPELCIATLDRDGSLEMEIEVRKGRGYIPAERNKREGAPIGIIPVASNFSPVQRVACKVEPLKSGDPWSREKLILELWTDGGVEPQEALKEAAAILDDQLQIFLGIEEEAEMVEEREVKETRQQLYAALRRNVEELELSIRAANCLRNSKIRFLYELVQMKEGDLLKMRNFGRKSLKELQGILKEMGLSLGMKLPQDFWQGLPEEARRMGQAVEGTFKAPEAL
ncbi:MAG: DNA-directed RNA polymerase subunit alpha [candidate division NC10 bacterium]|nr:DNA-directed RNA polymerase subunit alpha [candidate division NC10 bacterium]